MTHRYQRHGQSLSAKLAKHIGDASWHALITKLAYKAKEQGKHLVKIDPWFVSSKTCHVCQHKRDAMPLNIQSWACPTCHRLHERDINVALNIQHQGILKLKAEGLSVSAHGGSRKSGRSPVAAQEVGSAVRVDGVQLRKITFGEGFIGVNPAIP